MPATVLIGAQWGDEGKGRVADWLAAQSDVVARYAGGDNAGHTVSVGSETFKLHLIPSGILHESALCILGHGMVVNPAKLLQELDMLRERGVNVSPERVMLSERAHIITPAHMEIDAANEASRGDEAIGTTKRGIGPAYTDKVQRSGIQAHLMRDPEAFGDALHEHIARANRILELQYGQKTLDSKTIAATYTGYANRLAPYIQNIMPVIHDALDSGKRILCEGAQGTLLDLDLGNYPFVTSSSPSVAGALSGLAFGPRHIDKVVGVTKAFSTRVGSGPMPTEQDNEIGQRLRGTGEKPWDEYGTTTGRARRCGWLDIISLRYAAQANGFTELVLTKLDVLSGFEELQICVGYELNGKRYDTLPSSLNDLAQVTPVYETLPGWQEDIMDVREWTSLPKNAQNYISRVAELCGCPVAWVSVGPERDQVVML